MRGYCLRHELVDSGMGYSYCKYCHRILMYFEPVEDNDKLKEAEE